MSVGGINSITHCDITLKWNGNVFDWPQYSWDRGLLGRWLVFRTLRWGGEGRKEGCNLFFGATRNYEKALPLCLPLHTLAHAQRPSCKGGSHYPKNIEGVLYIHSRRMKFLACHIVYFHFTKVLIVPFLCGVLLLETQILFQSLLLYQHESTSLPFAQLAMTAMPPL